MGRIQRCDHVGLTVSDLAGATDFFTALGLRIEGTTQIEGEFVETVCGLPGAVCDIVMLRSPDGFGLELSRFVHPAQIEGTTSAMANETGLRNVSFEVDDLAVILATASEHGFSTVGGVGTYRGSVSMAYLRGPDGIVVSVFQQH